LGSLEILIVYKFSFSDAYYTRSLVRSDSDMRDWLDANEEVSSTMDQEGEDLWFGWRKTNFCREVERKFNDLKADFANGLITDAKEDRDFIVNQHYKDNPYPAFLSHLGHMSFLRYKGVGSEFQVSKIYYRREGKGYASHPELFNSSFDIKMLPSLIFNLEKLYQSILKKLASEGKPADIYNEVPEKWPEFKHDDLREHAPDEILPF